MGTVYCMDDRIYDMSLSDVDGVHYSGKGGTVVDVFGERRYNEVMEDVWGHLKAEENRTYHGWMLVYMTFNGYFGIIDWEFEDLDGSPWQYEHFNAWVNKYVDYRNSVKNAGGPDMEPGLYLYKGWYKTYKSGKAKFQPNDFQYISVKEILDVRNSSTDT